MSNVVNKICSKKRISISNLRPPSQNFDFIYSQVFFNIKSITQLIERLSYSSEEGGVVGERYCENLLMPDLSVAS